MKNILIIILLSSCSQITPQDREVAYGIFAKDIQFKCAAYHFDLSANLTPEVPAMTKICATFE